MEGKKKLIKKILGISVLNPPNYPGMIRHGIFVLKMKK